MKLIGSKNPLQKPLHRTALNKTKCPVRNGRSPSNLLRELYDYFGRRLNGEKLNNLEFQSTKYLKWNGLHLRLSKRWIHFYIDRRLRYKIYDCDMVSLLFGFVLLFILLINCLQKGNIQRLRCWIESFQRLRLFTLQWNTKVTCDNYSQQDVPFNECSLHVFDDCSIILITKFLLQRF